MVLLMASALISGAEVALFGLSKTAVEEITDTSEFAGKRISSRFQKFKYLNIASNLMTESRFGFQYR